MASARRGTQARGWREAVCFITLTCSVSGKKGKQALRSPTLGLQAAMFGLQHTRIPPNIPGTFFDKSWGSELSITSLYPVVHSLLRAVPSVRMVKQLTTSCLPDFTWFILHPVSPARVLCVTQPAAGQGQGRGDARTGASGATLTPV